MSLQLTRLCGASRRLLEATRAGLEAYKAIVEPTMGYPRLRELDSSAAFEGLVDCFCTCNTLNMVSKTLEGRRACVVGPSWLGPVTGPCDIILAPEGSIPVLLRLGLKALVLTGDGDAALKYLHMVPAVSEVFALHIHGDNGARVAEIATWLARSVRLILTSQVETPYCIVPLGAFTDGDRAAALAMYSGASSVDLLGFTTLPIVCGHKDFCNGRQRASKSTKIAVGMKALKLIAGSLGYAEEHDNKGTIRFRRQPEAGFYA